MKGSFQGKDISLLICRNKILLFKAALKRVHRLSVHVFLRAITHSAMFVATKIILWNQAV